MAYPEYDKKTLTLLAKITAKEGKAAEFHEILTDLIEPTRAEKGCIHYDLFKSRENENLFVFHETWATEEDWQAHMESDHIKSLLAKLDEYVDSEIEIGKWVRNKAEISPVADSSALVLTAEITAKEGREKHLKDALEVLLAPSRAEEGCINYDLHIAFDEENEGKFLFQECWESVEAWEKHMEAEHLKAFFGIAPMLIEGEVVINKLQR